MMPSLILLSLTLLLASLLSLVSFVFRDIDTYTYNVTIIYNLLILSIYCYICCIIYVYTGSVAGGRAVYKTVAERRFIDVGLELGGKDAMYVADDADLNSAVENAVDGACYNAGQV